MTEQPTDEQVSIDRTELDTLLAVATLYLESFTDDDPMSLTEKLGHQDVEAVVAKYGRRY
jgi:hypothetical protein